MADSRRSSSSSHPSAASLKFGFASKNVEHAESSSRGLQATSGNRASSRSPAPMDTNTDAGEEDIRVPKTRRTGGFLLPSSLRHADSNRRQKSDSKVKSKGKGKEDALQRTSLRPASPFDSSRQNGAIRSSPLGHVVITPRPSYGDSQIPRPSTPFGSQSRSDTSSPRDGVSSDFDRARSEYSHEGPYQQQPAGIDPAQIVNMALNLSESRRRNMTAGQIVSSPATNGRRVSSGIPLPSTMVQGSYTANGVGSLRQHIQQQRHISRTHSPTFGRKTPSQRLASNSHLSPPVLDDSPVQQKTFDHQYHVSSATLARAEKARQYIELSLEYRRLLQYLPPLKPDATSGSSTFATSNVPGTTNVHLHRTTTLNPDDRHDLGRRYNPLQLIRNRKLRARTRNPLDPDIEHWQDTGAVKDWVDQVELASQRPGYRQLDKVNLPPYAPHDGLGFPGSTNNPKDIGHRRNDGSISKLKRPRQDWSFSPAEHLADAYWLEQDGNKVLIENRIGNPVYQRFPSTESLHPRASYESRASNSKSVPASVASHEKEESDRESHKGSERRVKRPLLGHGRDESRGRFKHVWNKARGRSRSSSSGLSSSDGDASAREQRPKIVVPSGDEENIGPLERQMNKLLDADLGESPTFSPGTPNKWGTDFPTAPVPRHEVHPATQPQEEVLVPTSTEVQDFVELAVPINGAVTHHKRPSRIFEDPNELRSSFDDDKFATSPSSPVVLPTTDLGLSTRSRSASPVKKQKKSILPFIRAEGRRDRRKLDSGGSHLDDSDAKSSRHTSSEVPAKTRGSLDIGSSPIRVKNLISHRTNESLDDPDSRPSSRGKDNRDGKEPESAVRRFLKGGRLGEMVRHEGAKVGGYIRKRDSPQDVVDEFVHADTDSLEESDTEDTDVSRTFKERPNLLKRTTSAVTGRKDKRPQYHLDNLPSFKPTNPKASAGPLTPSDQDHISQQKLALTNSRSPRFDHLKPPGLDLSAVTSSPSENRGDIYHTALPSQDDDRRHSYGFPPLQQAKSRNADRLKAILDRPGGVGRGGLPMTGLTNIRRDSDGSRHSLFDRRHWSIGDQPRSSSPYPPPTISKASISKSDIARVQIGYISACIKAAEIHRRAYQIRNPPPKFLRLAAESSNASLRPVPRKEEHVLAARLLTTCLENESVAFHQDMERFRLTTVETLNKDLIEMKDVVESCIERARDEADEAMRFGAEITGSRTIEIRRVVDALEKLARARRRRLRWLRRVGFGLVEWGVVLVMWWIWLLVTVWKASWGTVRGIGRAVRWVFWL
ncbi:hypothetical protein FKW77_002192 [Venturia effusa]|uniref:Uncharacterized protein n=1 Tax=Venturia effusa TaxID=50376 RepID=A0A517KZ62_9PEZI|nr:hypothetical protein FKW77_002192 [Venturia effusa]